MIIEKLHFGSLIDGKEILGGDRVIQEVRSPYNNELVGEIEYADHIDMLNAIDSAYQAYQCSMKKMPAYERSNILRKVANYLEEEANDFATLLSREAGKPISDSLKEVNRSIQILNFAAEEAKQISGQLISMDSAIGGENRIGMVQRNSLGVVAAITPFNFPLNLVLHKLAPAIAAGNTVVLKPAEKTSLTAIKLARLFYRAGLPTGALNVVLGIGQELVPTLVQDERVSKVTFTGSGAVGLKIKNMAGLKKVTLELGSNSPNIVFEDADIPMAVEALVKGAFAFSGQVCVSVQRIYVHQKVYNKFLNEFVETVQRLEVGDPMNPATDVGPMINEEEAIRAEKWIKEATLEGAKIVTGGKRSGSVFYPTTLTNVNERMIVVCKEVFAPVVSIIPFDTEEEVIKQANNSIYGLQAGVFTKDINRALSVANALETGGVWINEASTYRQDNYPYGGVKQSGIGKEGVKYAVEDMTEMKFIGIKLN